MKQRILFLPLVCFVFNSIAQVRELNIGDTVPDLEIPVIVNHKPGRAKLADYRGKLVIIDFWSTYCAPCIAAMPKMDSLQKHFGDKIVILPAIRLSKINEKLIRYIDSFWSNNEYTKNTSLPTIIDTNLNKYFPHEGVPHEVWISPSGELIGLTDGEYVNSKEIEKTLAGFKVDWPINKFIEFNESTSLFDKKGITISNGKIRSEVRKNLQYIIPTTNMIVDSPNNIKRFYVINFDIKSLYLVAYQRKIKGNQYLNRLYINTPDSTTFFKPAESYAAEWLRKNTFCYETITSISTPDSIIFNRMINDLDAYFNIESSLKIVSRDCFVLSKIGNGSTNLLTGLKYRISDLINELNIYFSKDKPVILSNDIIKDTNYFVTLPADKSSWKSINAMKRDLLNNGFNLDDRNVEVNSISLTDNRKEGN